MAKKLSKTRDIGAGFRDTINHGKVKDVTTTNYTGKASAVAALKKPFGVNICPIDNPREWGAWTHYFKQIEKSVAYMQSLGVRRSSDLSAPLFWVPTPMPFEFDSDRLEITDRSAADRFEAAQLVQREKVAEMGTEDHRLKQAQEGIGRARDGMRLPKDHNWRKERPAPPVLPDHDPKRWHDRGELKASRDRMFNRLGMTLPQQERDDA